MVSGIVLLRKGADSDDTLEAIHAKTKELNDHLLPPGVKVVPFLDRSELLHLTTHTVMHNLTEGIILVSVILFLFLGNVRGALIVTLTIPFSLLFASICLNLRHIPANLLSLGALDFGMIVEGAMVMVENIVRLLSHPGQDADRDGAAKDQPRRVRSAAAGFLLDPDHHRGLCADFHACRQWKAGCSSRWPGPWRSRFWALCCSRMFVGPVLASLVFPKGTKEWHNPLMGLLTRGLRLGSARGDPLALGYADGGGGDSGRRGPAGAEHRIRISAASGRRRDLGARHSGAEHRTVPKAFAWRIRFE